jgi:hypothetical protein
MASAALGAGRRRQAETALGQPAGQLSAAVLEQAHVVADQFIVALERQFAVVMFLEPAVEVKLQAHRPVGAGPDAGNAAADQWTAPQWTIPGAETAVMRAVAVSQAATNHRGAAWGRRGV